MKNLFRNNLIKKQLRFAAKKQTVQPTKDVVNIFKDKKEPQLKKDEEYPIWLFELCYPKYNLHKKRMVWMKDKANFNQPRLDQMDSYFRNMKREKLRLIRGYEIACQKKTEDDRDTHDDFYLKDEDEGYVKNSFRPYIKGTAEEAAILEQEAEPEEDEDSEYEIV